MLLDTHELAWAAGFFDGEGTTGCVRQRHRPGADGVYRYDYPAVHILVSQNHDARVLHRFRAAVGHVGVVYGPYERRGSQSWVYNAIGFEKAQAVIAMLWKWMGPVKQQQAAAALAAYTTEMREKAYRPYLRGVSHRPKRSDGERVNASAFRVKDDRSAA